MKRVRSPWMLVALLCCGASQARAHAPLPRALAVAPGDADAARIAVRMPGFGWLLSAPGTSAAAPAYAYACDALLGVSPLEEQAPMAFRSDGTLIAGTANGIRFLSPDGCPATATPLSGDTISALAVYPGAGEADRVYAISEGEEALTIVQRSDDGGEHWTQGATLERLPVSALVVGSHDPDSVYVSQAGSAAGGSIAVSSDGGATFKSIAQERALTLVHVQDEPARFWATARIAGKGVGVDILRAERVQGPWQVVLSVNFFGGFAVDPHDPDVIWIGDEARGVYRSHDGGNSFDKVQPDVAASCLAYGGDALWACTPGLPQRTALVRSPDALTAFEPIMAFADVTHMVECGAQTDVKKICAAAWFEWQRDVLMTIPAETAPATMAVADAGPAAAPVPDAGQDAGDERTPSKSSCTVGVMRRPAFGAPGACLVLALVLLARRQRDTR